MSPPDLFIFVAPHRGGLPMHAYLLRAGHGQKAEAFADGGALLVDHVAVVMYCVVYTKRFGALAWGVCLTERVGLLGHTACV